MNCRCIYIWRGVRARYAAWGGASKAPAVDPDAHPPTCRDRRAAAWMMTLVALIALVAIVFTYSIHSTLWADHLVVGQSLSPSDARRARAVVHRPLALEGGGRQQEPPSRTLLFITTHMSRVHFDALKYCWRTTITRSPLLQEADVMVAATLGPEVSLAGVAGIVSAAFDGLGRPHRSIRVEALGNLDYQEGAMLSMRKACENGWFVGYDWVVRLNPDVIVRNDSWVLRQMRNESIDGIFARCNDRPIWASKGPMKVHTDFTVFRPRALAPGSFSDAYTNAEWQASRAFADTLRSGRYALLPSGPHWNKCRVRGEASPVVHSHDTPRSCQQTYDPSTFLHGWGWANVSA